jgi:hypothetical protein
MAEATDRELRAFSKQINGVEPPDRWNEIRGDIRAYVSQQDEESTFWLLFGPGGNGLKHIIFGIHLLAIVLAVLLGIVALLQKRPIAVIPVLVVLPLFYIQFLS